MSDYKMLREGWRHCKVKVIPPDLPKPRFSGAMLPKHHLLFLVPGSLLGGCRPNHREQINLQT